MVIEVSSQIPVIKPLYRRSQAESEKFKQLNQKLLIAGIIEGSTSPYNNPQLAMRKKSGKKRLVNNFRDLNQLIIPLYFPIPMVSQILDMLAESLYFFTYDMTSGFFQCPLTKESRKYTTYSTQKGQIFTLMVLNTRLEVF